MEARSCLHFLADKIHTVVLATADGGIPFTCAIDVMLAGDSSIYFLTAVGKALYGRLMANPNVALTGLCGEDTMHSRSVSLRGLVREIGRRKLQEIFEKNPYMADIYPDPAGREALRVFELYQGQGEFFDLSVRPIVRESFSFGGAAMQKEEFRVGSGCSGCRECIGPCPQGCIEMRRERAYIVQEHCLRCGACAEVCPLGVIAKKTVTG